MSQLFIDAVAGGLQGLQQYQTEKKVEEKEQYNRDLVERKMAMEQARLDESLATSRQVRSIKDLTMAEMQKDIPLKDVQRRLQGKQLETQEKLYDEFGEEIARDKITDSLAPIRQIEIENPTFFQQMKDDGTLQMFQDNAALIKMLGSAGNSPTVRQLAGSESGTSSSPKAVKGAKEMADMQAKFISTLAGAGIEGKAKEEVLVQYNQTMQKAFESFTSGNDAEGHKEIANGYSTLFPALNNYRESVKSLKTNREGFARDDANANLGGSREINESEDQRPLPELVGLGIERTPSNLLLGNTEQREAEDAQVRATIMDEAESVAAELGVREIPEEFLDRLSKADTRNLRAMSKDRLREMLKKELTPYIEQFGAPLLDVEVLPGRPTNARFSGSLIR